MINRKPIFDAVRGMLGRGMTQAEVPVLDRAIDTALGAEPHKRSLADPDAFYAAVRHLTGRLDQVQVDSIDAILRESATYPLSHTAYMLGTGWHEARFRPQEEWGKGKGRAYAKPGARLKAIANAPLYGGQIPYGRGLAQLTWVDNYEWADKRFGLNGALLANFDLALTPDLAAKVLVVGMAEGAFGQRVGKTLPADDRPATHEQFRLARPSVNVMDKAAQIANYAELMQAALLAGGWA